MSTSFVRCSHLTVREPDSRMPVVNKSGELIERFSHIYRAYYIKTEFNSSYSYRNQFWWHVHKAFWHLKNPHTQICAICKRFSWKLAENYTAKSTTLNIFKYFCKMFNFYTVVLFSYQNFTRGNITKCQAHQVLCLKCGFIALLVWCSGRYQFYWFITLVTKFILNMKWIKV